MAGSRSTLLAALLTAVLSLELILPVFSWKPSPNDFLIPFDVADIEGWFAKASLGATDPILASAEKHRVTITVKQDGTGAFKTVQEAINSIPVGNRRRTYIQIGPGVYKEKVIIDPGRPFITLVGDPNAMPTITWGDTAATNNMGTYPSATVGVDANHFTAANIIFENSAPDPGDGKVNGQAVALRIKGDKAAFYNCKFLGYQDTLLDAYGKHFFKDCYIRGTVDFIFGNGRSIYLNCVIESVAKGATAITAQGRESGAEKGGFSFVHCKIIGSGKATLSRAWKQKSRVVFSYTFMDTLVDPTGWDDKGFKDRRGTVYYGEYKCSGPGAASGNRAEFGMELTDTQVRPYLSAGYIRAEQWLQPPPTY